MNLGSPYYGCKSVIRVSFCTPGEMFRKALSLNSGQFSIIHKGQLPIINCIVRPP